MLGTTINARLAGALAQAGYSPLPSRIIDRDGLPMDVSGSVWVFNNPAHHLQFNWDDWGLENPVLAYALERYVMHVSQRNSSMEAHNTARYLKYVLTADPEKWGAIQVVTNADELAHHLYELLSSTVEVLKRKNRLYRFHRTRAWYGWCADMLPDLGFSEEYALQLDQIKVPGNRKGEAVRTDDEDGGPLYETEVLALVAALEKDRDASIEREHVMQRAAVAIGLAYGRNPANYALLREEDLSNKAPDAQPEGAAWMLKIPRIKKRGVKARDAFIEEYVENDVARYLLELVDSNRMIDTGDLPRPLFMRDDADPRRIGTPLEDYAFHLDTGKFKQLIQAFVARMGVISPRTGGALVLTPRRLRYTFATAMVERGISRQALARLLDHSDTQHVTVYYALKGKRLIAHLDKAAAQKIGPLINAFRGRLIDSLDEAVNGSNPARRVRFSGDDEPDKAEEVGVCGLTPLCRLDPPFSCYVCPLFQPFRQADHEAVLGELLKSREERMDKYSLQSGISLDEVIFAVGQVCATIRAERRAGNG